MGLLQLSRQPGLTEEERLNLNVCDLLAQHLRLNKMEGEEGQIGTGIGISLYPDPLRSVASQTHVSVTMNHGFPTTVGTNLSVCEPK